MSKCAYYSIWMELWSVQSDDDWIREEVERGELGCMSCDKVLSPRKIDAVVLGTELLAKVATVTTWRPRKKLGGSIGIIDNRLVDIIGIKAIEELFYVGTISYKGKSRQNHISIVARSGDGTVTPRSSSPLIVRKCKTCKTVCYVPDIEKNMYVMNDEVEALRPLYQSDNPGELYVRSDIAEPLKVFKKRGLKMKELELIASPPDGLPVDLNQLDDDFVIEPT